MKLDQRNQRKCPETLQSWSNARDKPPQVPSLIPFPTASSPQPNIPINQNNFRLEIKLDHDLWLRARLEQLKQQHLSTKSAPPRVPPAPSKSRDSGKQNATKTTVRVDPKKSSGRALSSFELKIKETSPKQFWLVFDDYAGNWDHHDTSSECVDTVVDALVLARRIAENMECVNIFLVDETFFLF